MDANQAATVINQIEMLFGRDYPQAARKALVESLAKEPVGIIPYLVEKLEYGEKYLPTPAFVMQTARDLSAMNREKSAAEEKKLYADSPHVLDREYNSEEAALACRLARAALHGLEPIKILEGFKHMHNKFPSSGWDKRGTELQRHYRVNNIIK